jgi:hypothetical protein
MDLESQKTIDEAIDRVRDEIVNPILAELASLRALIGRLNGATVTLALGPSDNAKEPT